MDHLVADSPGGSRAGQRVTRLLAVTLIALSIVTLVPRVGKRFVHAFALIPQATFGKSRFWNVVTGGFVDTNQISAVCNVAVLLTVGRWIEPVWGGRQYLLFLLVVNTCAGVFAYAALYVGYVATRASSLLFTPTGGAHAMVLGLLVAVKQLIPEHEIGVNGVAVKANYLPLAAVVLHFVAVCVRLTSIGVVLYVLSGFYSAWVYLRFYQSKDAGVRGDASNAFAFATLFPHPLRSFAEIAGNVAFAVFKPVLLAGESGNSAQQTPAEAPIPVSKAAPVDAERRRQRALKALDERLNATGEAPDDSPV